MVINEVTILVWIVCGIGSFLIAQSRGATNAPTWFLVGILLGPIGILLAAIGAKGPVGRAPKIEPRADAIATLKQLAQLKTDGHITAEEYDPEGRLARSTRRYRCRQWVSPPLLGLSSPTCAGVRVK